MKKTHLAAILLLALPNVAAAQSLQAFLTNIVIFFNNTVLPFLLGMAFLIFVFNAVRFFVFGSTSVTGEGSSNTIQGDRGKARALALYGVLAFLLIIVFWGIINLLVSSFGLVSKDGSVDVFNSSDYINPTPRP